jgi:hypothetical protein
MGRRRGLPEGTQLYVRASFPCQGRGFQLWQPGAASGFMASVVSNFREWGRCRCAAVSDRAEVSGGYTVDLAVKNFAQPCSHGRLENSHANDPRWVPVVTSFVIF